MSDSALASFVLKLVLLARAVGTCDSLLFCSIVSLCFSEKEKEERKEKEKGEEKVRLVSPDCLCLFLL